MSHFAPLLTHTSAPIPEVLEAAHYRAEARTLWRRAADLNKSGNVQGAMLCAERARAFSKIDRMISWAPPGTRKSREVAA